MTNHLAVLLAGSVLLSSGGDPGVPPEREAVESAITRAAGHLARMVQTDGMFVYRVNLNPEIEVRKKYNILRHAGTIYALCDCYRYRPSREMKYAVERAGRYLKREAISAVDEWDDVLAVWSRPEVNHSDRPRQAKLGGTGLGLVALLSIERSHPGFTSLAELQALGRFIVRMQKEDGRFVSKYVPSIGGPDDRWQSLYYPGEAALGLLMLHELDPSGEWQQSATEALTYLARSRRDSTDIPADHWALLATAKLLALSPDRLPPEIRRQLVDHTAQICESILADQVIDPDRPLHDGGFTEEGRTTPTAARLEGLLAAQKFLPPEHPMRPRIREAIRRGITFLVRAQVKEGRFAGAFTRAVSTIDPGAENAESFNRRATEIRIDYTQHALSALLEFQRTRMRTQSPGKPMTPLGSNHGK